MTAEWQEYTVRVRSADLELLREAEAAVGWPPMEPQTEVAVCVAIGIRRRIEYMRDFARNKEPSA